MATSRLGQAEKSLERVVQLNPGVPEAYNELGNLAMREKRPRRAVRAYQRAVEMDPHDSVYMENLKAAQRAAARQH